MKFKDHLEVVERIKALQEVPKWVKEARLTSKTLRALVFGDGFLEELIEQIEKIESSARSIARKKYSKDIRDMFSRVFEPRSNIFSASGGSVHMDIASEKIKEKFIIKLSEFKGNLSIDKYLSEYFFELVDVDPNGLMMLEYVGDEKVYPAYKSINDIRYYKSDGQNVDVLFFEPIVIKRDTDVGVVKEWRVVDSVTDWRIIEENGMFKVDEERTFRHPFGYVPAVILSSVQKLGTEIRLSPLFPIVELAKDYSRDKSILTLYKFLHGFPVHWRYYQQCRACRGTGKTGEKDSVCPSCDGKGRLGKNDVTDILEIPTPKDGDDAIIAPNLAGFVAPDLDTWRQYKSDQVDDEEKIDATIWGTRRKKDGGNETATARFIDVQPVMTKLNSFADNVEWVQNQLSKWVLYWCENNPNTNSTFHMTYGRAFIIESPDQLLLRYQENKKEGSSFTLLDKLLAEYLMSKYRNNPIVLQRETKKAILEPFIHVSLLDTFAVFGSISAQQKQLFGDFWEQVDKSKEVEVLRKERDAYFTANVVVPVVVIPLVSA